MILVKRILFKSSRFILFKFVSCSADWALVKAGNDINMTNSLASFRMTMLAASVN